MRKNLQRLFAALCVLAAYTAAAAEVDLEGLWKAQRRYGPDARGTLTVTKTDTGWSADFAGRTIPISIEGSDLRFELAGDAGAFRGRQRSDGTITGHWIQPPSITNGSRYASPDRKSTRLNSSHIQKSRMPSSA